MTKAVKTRFLNRIKQYAEATARIESAEERLTRRVFTITPDELENARADIKISREYRDNLCEEIYSIMSEDPKIGKLSDLHKYSFISNADFLAEYGEYLF